jgi:hypothetical protein
VKGWKTRELKERLRGHIFDILRPFLKKVGGEVKRGFIYKVWEESETSGAGFDRQG